MNTKEYLVQSIVSQMTIYLMNDYNWDMQTDTPEQGISLISLPM